jgi:dienelactone hydrolase
METAGAITFIGETRSERGVDERRFDLVHRGRTVPAIVFTPTGSTAPVPLVAVGHGGTNHKRAEVPLFVCRRLARRGVAAVSIDAPFHGERDEPGVRWSVDQPGIERMAKLRDVTLIDDMVEDWTEAVAAVRGLPEIGQGSTAYWGWSMGTHFGLPYVASAPDLVAASLGLYGTALPRHAEAAADVRCPVHFTVQWDDELIARTSALDLFDRLASGDKQLVAHPGRHVQVPKAELETSVDFLLARLAGAA